jgi:hypothetical protein
MIVAIKIINEMHQEINSTQNEREKTWYKLIKKWIGGKNFNKHFYLRKIEELREY